MCVIPLLPQAIIIDEIGTEAECQAARTIAQRGVQLVATAHGNALENVIKNPALNLLVGGIQVWKVWNRFERHDAPPINPSSEQWWAYLSGLLTVVVMFYSQCDE